jgi:hypothetical protein
MNKIQSTEATVHLNGVEKVADQVRELSAAEVIAVAGGPTIKNQPNLVQPEQP